MGEVVEFDGLTTLDISPDSVLKSAVGKLEKVVLIGIDLDGNPYDASSFTDGCEVLWMLEKFKLRMLDEY